MATIKLNVVGATKSLEVYARANGACENCENAISFHEYQIDHVFPRNNALYGVKGLHDIENLSCLCKVCNSAKGDSLAMDFYDDDVWERINKTRFVRVSKDKLYAFGAQMIKAQGLQTSKFARLFRGGMFYKGAN